MSCYLFPQSKCGFKCAVSTYVGGNETTSKTQAEEEHFNQVRQQTSSELLRDMGHHDGVRVPQLYFFCLCCLVNAMFPHQNIMFGKTGEKQRGKIKT